MIFWPTRSANLTLLDPATGYPHQVEPLRSPAGEFGPFGNLAYADGVLVVVSATEVLGYVAEDHQPAPRPGPESVSVPGVVNPPLPRG